MDRLHLILYSLVLVLVCTFSAGLGGLWYGYHWGYESADNKCKAESEKRLLEATKELKDDTDKAYGIAAEYENQLHEMETHRAKTKIIRIQSAQLPVVCPTSGRIGDVVLPVDFISGMFNRLPAAAPGTAASEPAPAVPGGAASSPGTGDAGGNTGSGQQPGVRSSGVP